MLGYNFYWLSASHETRKVCHKYYSQPQKGGQCKAITEQIVQEFPGFQPFAATKIVAAMICRYFGNISSDAIRKELDTAVQYNVFGGSITEYIKRGCKNTIVQHTVGYCNDVGNKKETSFLENRIVMKGGHSNTTRGKQREHGRGGGDNGDITYALLDWPKKK